MKINLLVLSVAWLLIAAMPAVNAQNSADAANSGDSAAGKDKAASCGSCHGEDGNSLAPNFPKLAQQHPSYIIKQLRAFKDGSRVDPMMSGMAMAINDADLPDIAAFYASQKISANPEPTLPPEEEPTDAAAPPPANTVPKLTMPELLKMGANLYRNGNLESGVSACIACHGPNGEGNKPAAFPTLHAQHADYLIKSLNDFKVGTRANKPDSMMGMIAKKMTDDEIKAVGYFISTLK